MNSAWRSPRVVWGLVGAVALVAGGAGAYLSLYLADEKKPADPSTAARGGPVLRIHDAPRKLPDLAFEDAEGRKRTLSQFGGKVVLLNVWATWCAPCREEMPSLDRVQQKLGGPEFEVLALSIDTAGIAAVKRFYDEIGIRSLALYVDTSMRTTSAIGAVGLPITLLIDRQGREIGHHIGPAQWDSPEVVRRIEGYLDKGRKS